MRLSDVNKDKGEPIPLGGTRNRSTLPSERDLTSVLCEIDGEILMQNADDIDPLPLRECPKRWQRNRGGKPLKKARNLFRSTEPPLNATNRTAPINTSLLHSA